jgi:hypothetical protein
MYHKQECLDCLRNSEWKFINMAWENLDEERLKQIIRQISGKTPKTTDKLVQPSRLIVKVKNGIMCRQKENISDLFVE